MPLDVLVRINLPSADQILTPAEQSRMLADFARSQLRDVLAAGNAAPVYLTYVDGREGASEATVRPQGDIRYRFQVLQQIAADALDMLRQASPVASGRYRDSHQIFIGSRPIDDPKQIPARLDAIVISNLQSYARKIEVGHMRMSVAPLIYQHVANQLESAYKGVVSVDNPFLVFPGGYLLKGRFRRGFREHARKKLAKDTARDARMTYPSLVLYRL